MKSNKNLIAVVAKKAAEHALRGESDNQFAQHQYKLLDSQGNPTGSYATCTYL